MKVLSTSLVARRNRRGRFDDLPEDMRRNLRQRAAGGNGAYPIIGDPDDVAGLLIRLHEAGIDAFAIGFANYNRAPALFPRRGATAVGSGRRALSRGSFRRLYRLPDPLRRCRHVDVIYAERL